MIHLKPRYLTLLLFSIIWTGTPAFSQEYPELFGSGPASAGTEFYLAFPANWEYQADEKFIRLYIGSVVETTVHIYALGEFKGSITTVPNDIVTFDLSNVDGQLFVRNDQDPVPDDQIYEGKAVHIVSNDPIVVYGMNRTSFTSDGLLALPVNALGEEYVVASAASVATGIQELPSQYMVIAPYDNTNVTITNPMNTPNHQAGETFTITLNSGDVYSSMSVGAGGDMTGAHIVADKPIGVTAGQNCTYLPSYEFPACDHLEEMLLPVESWGKHYHSIPFQNRTKGDTYRIIAGEANADIYVNGTRIATLNGVGGINGIGWIEYREEQRRPLEFSSNKRISVAQYNNSQSYDNANGSDPFYIVLSPVEQYQNELIFTTPGDDYPNNFINVIGDSAAIADVEISEAGQNNWQKLSSANPGTNYAFSTEVDGIRYKGVSTSIAPGAYALRSSGPIAGYLYAGAPFDSYGYPLSVATAALGVSIEQADVIPPSVVWVAGCRNSIPGIAQDVIGEDQDLRTHIATVRLSPNSVNYALTVEPFEVGSSDPVEFHLRLIDPHQSGKAILIVTDRAGNVNIDSITYTFPSVSVSPDFGKVSPNESKQIEVELRNDGNYPIQISELRLFDGTKGFEVISPTGSFTIAAGEMRMVTLRFTGSQDGVYVDSLVLVNDCGELGLTPLSAQVETITGVKDRAANTGGLDLAILSNPVEENQVTIEYYLPKSASASIEIFTAAGASVRTVSLPSMNAGEHRTQLDLTGLPSGMYLCLLTDGVDRTTRVLTLLR